MSNIARTLFPDIAAFSIPRSADGLRGNLIQLSALGIMKRFRRRLGCSIAEVANGKTFRSPR